MLKKQNIQQKNTAKILSYCVRALRCVQSTLKSSVAY
jgi:hypothetical protein